MVNALIGLPVMLSVAKTVVRLSLVLVGVLETMHRGLVGAVVVVVLIVARPVVFKTFVVATVIFVQTEQPAR